MTSQERILSALKRENVDRVPLVVFGINPYPNSWMINDPTFENVLVSVKEKTDVFYRSFYLTISTNS
jgi:hypothetical protein